jgi:hypothetical protein
MCEKEVEMLFALDGRATPQPLQGPVPCLAKMQFHLQEKEGNSKSNRIPILYLSSQGAGVQFTIQCSC